MENLGLRKLAIIFAHALVLWIFCGVLMFVGMSLVPLESALVIHVLGAPLIAVLVSWVYFKQFNYTLPLVTAFLFIGIVIFMDFFVVALLIEQSFAMFGSFIGTWLPFILIFAATFLTGYTITTQSKTATRIGQ